MQTKTSLADTALHHLLLHVRSALHAMAQTPWSPSRMTTLTLNVNVFFSEAQKASENE